jgi:hypothetical protein
MIIRKKLPNKINVTFLISFCIANCNFDNGDACSYQNGAGEFNWKVNTGSTPSIGTGPSSDVSGIGKPLNKLLGLIVNDT